MQDSPANKALIMDTTETVRQTLGEHIRWQWDDHHQALLSEFSVDHEHAAFHTLLQHFPYQWDRKSIKKAPTLLKHRAQHFLPNDKRQLLLTADESGTQEVMVAWWPWGHGATISVRIFRADPSQPLPQQGIIAKLRQFFLS